LKDPENLRLIFGTSVHVGFDSFIDLYKGVKKFFNDPVYLYASNEGLGKSCGNLKKIESKRNYKWRRSHNFIFDAAEALRDYDYDYFIALDSDCLACGNKLTAFLKNRGIDFVIYPNLNGLGGWYHGNIFLENIKYYLEILGRLGIKRRGDDIVGNFNPLIILSKRAVDFLRSNIDGIESSYGYKELMKLDFSIGETLIFNILKDAGFKSVCIDPEVKAGLRYRPYWEAREYKNEIAIYHPVRLKNRDIFRRLVCIRSGLDKRYYYLPFICVEMLYKRAYIYLFGKGKLDGEGDTWFNA
jgi:hypothetical protein